MKGKVMFKMIKSWAVGAAGGYAKSYFTVDKITELVIDAVNGILEKATKNVDDAKMAGICETITKVSDLCGKLSKAIADKKVTVEEANDIVSSVKDVIGTSGLTDAAVCGAIDHAVKAIQEKI